MDNNILLYLKTINMTQRELAKKVGTTETSISRYIDNTRKPNVYIAIKIARALGTTVEKVFYV